MAEVENETPEILPPSPDQIAMLIIQGLAASGKYEDFEALIGQAWSAVPHYYLWREKYATQIAPMFFRPITDGLGFGPTDADFEAQLATVRLGLGAGEDAAPDGPDSEPDEGDIPHMRV